jgi:PhoD-like phosphatase
VTHLRVGPLVRATSADSTIIWSEWTHTCAVSLTAWPDVQPNGRQADVLTLHTDTITVGGRHYAALQLTGLQAATWYTYHLTSSMQANRPSPETTLSTSHRPGLRQCFRTLDPLSMDQGLRLAYGSCRKLDTPAPDALSAFGSWLIRHIDERETVWPRLLLLIGDQIYADEQIGRRKRAHTAPQGKRPITTRLQGAQTFADFASLYEQVWTSDDGIRQVLAVLPTFMILDDHEITNSWNIAPTWRAQALQRGMEQTLVDGLVAYWLYQGWGNLRNQSPDSNILLSLMQEAVRSGEDALEALRACVKREVYGETHLRWHYDIPTSPPIFVADLRADRPAIFNTTAATDAPARIMSQEQMGDLQKWMQQYASSTILLVSSVPALLPPVIGFAEYVMGIRPFYRSIVLLRALGSRIARLQQKIALRMSFDHWPVFAVTWKELVRLFAAYQRDVIILSGDVHFSYAIEARRIFSRSRHRAKLYQLVSTPFCNTLHREDRRLIVGQSWIKQANYGGLSTRVLPLFNAQGAKRIPHDLLFQNTVALLTLQPRSSGSEDRGRYGIEQVYLGVLDGEMREIARVSGHSLSLYA